MILETAVLCLAINIYHEARGEMIPGQYAVGHVTMNRAQTPDKVCDTVMAPKQFSWTQGLVKKNGKRYTLKSRGYPKDAHAWWIAQRVAATILKRRDLDLSNGATFYHASYVQPSWSKSVEQTKRIGSHIFYRGK